MNGGSLPPWDLPPDPAGDAADPDPAVPFLDRSLGPVHVYGRNRYAAAVAERMPVAAFIDDFTTEPSWLGHPVCPLSAVPRDVPVVSCVVGAWPVTARRRLREHGVGPVVDYFRLARCRPDLFPAVHYLEDAPEDLRDNAGEYRWLDGILADEESRDTLRRLVRFRCLADLDAMEGFRYRVDEQYFPDLIGLRPGAVLVDGGAFDGDTALAFHRRFPDHGEIHCFEPVPALRDRAAERLAGVPGVRWVERGLSDRPGTARFLIDAGPANRADPAGSLTVALTPLDAEVAGRVDYLKLDVEGAETAALAGAAGVIRREHPHLAVCVYHRQSDFHRIPRQVLAIEPRYRVHLRHYTEGFVETVMYFVPT